MARTADPATVPGIPESRLAPADLQALPAAAAAPWTCRSRALLWLQRGTPPQFGWAGRPTGWSVVCLVEYLDSPVGSYHEVLAGVLLRPGRSTGLLPVAQVPFIAVDSLASVQGGRANWALPKTMADFRFDLMAGRAEVGGPGWGVRVHPARSIAPTARGGATEARPGRLPVRASFLSTGPLGRYRTTLRATGRPVRVETDLAGETLTGWLGSGRHTAFALTGTMTIAAPRQS